jgi:hypothetical protein
MSVLSIYGKMTVVQLRRELQIRKLKTSGKKAELVERLENMDKIQEYAMVRNILLL